MRINPEEVALAALKAYQESQGISYENPEGALPADLQAKLDEDKESERLGEFMGPDGQKLRRGKNGLLIGEQIR